MQRTLHLGTVEVRLILRNKITAFSAFVVPVALCVMAFFDSKDMPLDEWGPGNGQRFQLLMLLSVYMVSTTVFTARRQSYVLQRLRTSELTDAQVLTGVTAPIVFIGIVQTLLYFGFTIVVGAPMPQQPLLVLVGVLTGVLVSVTLGIATAALSQSVEATHITQMPVVLASLAGLIMVGLDNETAALAGVALPVTGSADLIAKGWSGASAGPQLDALPGPLLGLAGVAVWLLISGAVGAKYFRWEPRD